MIDLNLSFSACFCVYADSHSISSTPQPLKDLTGSMFEDLKKKTFLVHYGASYVVLLAMNFPNIDLFSTSLRICVNLLKDPIWKHFIPKTAWYMAKMVGSWTFSLFHCFFIVVKSTARLLSILDPNKILR